MMYQRKHVNNIKCDNWSYNVRYILESAGFAEVWIYPESVNTTVFSPVLLRLQYMYISNWRRDMDLCLSLFYIKNWKLIVQSIYKGMLFLKLDYLSSHNLFIETGRHYEYRPKSEKVFKM